MQILYFANLGEDNSKDIIASTGAREAVLCSCGNIPDRVRKAALKAKAKGLQLAIDNGNTTVIFKLIDEFSAKAQKLAKLRKQSEKKDSLLSPGLVKKYQDLVDEIITRTSTLASLERKKSILQEQVSLTPQLFICLEDLTIPLITNLDLEPAITGEYNSKLVELQNIGINAVKTVLSGKLGSIEGRPYATLHAFDYDSAYQVGKKAGKIKSLEGIATGLASFLNDRNYINSYMLKGKRIWTNNKKSIPYRYIRTLLVTLGLIDGFSSVRKGAIPYFHGLGAGSPILLPLLSLCTYGSPQFSVDSTSPEKNASMGKLFVNKPAPLTLSVAGIAQALIDGRRVWDCTCPACKEITKKLPFDITAARNFYKSKIAPKKIQDTDLEKEDGIGKFLSFCSLTRFKPNAGLIKQARIEHSHWALIEVIKELRSCSQSYNGLRKVVGRMCDSYKATTTSTYSEQIDECLKLIDCLRTR